jgi:hypothetical protein
MRGGAAEGGGAQAEEQQGELAEAGAVIVARRVHDFDGTMVPPERAVISREGLALRHPETIRSR